MRRIIADFVADREIIKIPNEDFYDETKYFANDGRFVKSLPFVTPVTLFNPVTRDTPQFMDGDRLKVAEVVEIDDTGVVVAGDAAVAVPAGEVWKVIGITVEGIMDLNAAARTWYFSMNDNLQTPLVNSANSWLSGVLAVGAGEDFQLHMGRNANVTYNTNGALVLAATGILATPFAPGATFNLNNTAANTQIADNVAISIKHITYEA